jgi:cytoskeletal protein RodZ
MTLGALVVLVVLVAAGIYMPRSNKTQAKNSEMAGPASSSAEIPKPADLPAQTPAPQSETPAPAPDNSAASPAAPTAESPAPPTQQAPATESVQKQASQMTRDLQPKAAAKAKLSAKNHSAASSAMEMPAAQPQPGEAASVPASATTAEMDEVEREVDQLSTRAAAVNSGLDRLQEQQSAAGYGLRGDMVAKQASLKNNLAKAQAAVEQGDVQRAKKYSGLAQADAEALEHFLGR